MKFNKKLDVDDYSSRNGQSIKYIVLHDTGNTTDSDEGNLNYFNNGQRYASAHYFVDDDSYSLLVEEWNSAWHCGDGYGKYGITNENSIGIEMCRVNNVVTATTEDNTIWLVKKLMQKYAIPLERVVRHYDASKKNCPSSFSANNWSRWNSFKKKLEGEKEEELVVVIGTNQEFKSNDTRVKGVMCYSTVDQLVFDSKGNAYKGYILKKGQGLIMEKAVTSNFIMCRAPQELKSQANFVMVYKSDSKYSNRIAIEKLVGDLPTTIIEKVVEVEKPLNLTKEICLEYLEKNLK